MATIVTGTYYSDLLVGQKEDVSDDLAQMVPSQTPFLNSIGFGSGTAYNTTHTYLDDAYVPGKGALGTTVTSAATTFVLTPAIAKAGERIEMQGEVILLGSTTDRLTFTGCTRSVSSAGGAAAAHTAGVPFTILGKGELQSVAAGTADTAYEPRTVTNYVQQYMRVIEVPDITNNARRYGRPGTAYDDDALIKMRDLKLNLEQSAIWGVATAPAGSTGTVGWMGGLFDRVVGTNTTAMATTSFTQEKLRTAVETIGAYYDPDANINAVLLCPIHQTFVFDSWQQAHVVIAPNDPLIAQYGVNARRLRIGPMLIDVIGVTRLYDQAFLYQPQYVKLLWYSGMEPKHEMLARDGLRARGMVSCAATMEIRCPEAHYVFTGLAAS